MVRINGILNAKTLIPIGVVSLALMIIPVLQLGMLASMPGDIGDARLNNYFLENIYQFFIGASSSLWHLSFFYPFPYVLGFSDNLFGSAPVYILARLCNASTETSYQIWFLFGYIVNYGASYYAIRRLGVSVNASTVGALIFTFALPTTAHAVHAQLHYRFGLPLAIVYFAEFLNRKTWRYLRISIAWLVWQFYAGVYIGFFTLFLLITLSLTYLVYVLHSGRISCKNLINDFLKRWCEQTKKQKVIFIGCLVVIFLLILFLFYPYLQVSHLYGAKRSWNEIESMLPRPQSYLISDNSFWWPIKGAEIFPGIPMLHEHQMFMGFFPLVLALGGFIIGRSEKNSLNFILITGMLCISVLMTLYIGGVSIWYLLHKLPLVSAIRAMTRLDQAFLFPIAYLAAITIEKIEFRYTWGSKAVFVLILPMIIFEAAMTSMYTSSKEFWRQRTSMLYEVVPKNLADNAILFFAQRSDPYFADELDAMWVSLKHGKKTMNGYSGIVPPGYDLEYGSDCAQIPRRVLSYLRFYKQPENVEAYREFMSRIVPIGFQNCDEKWLKEPPSITTTDRKYSSDEFKALSLDSGSVEKRGDQLLVRFSINNSSNNAFSANSSLGNPIRISWRFIDELGKPMSGWDARKDLLIDIPARSKMSTSIPLSISKIGNAKGVQITLVQELVFWGHDIGVQPLTIYFP